VKIALGIVRLKSVTIRRYVRPEALGRREALDVRAIEADVSRHEPAAIASLTTGSKKDSSDRRCTLAAIGMGHELVNAASIFD